MFCGVCGGLIGANSHVLHVDFSTPSRKDKKAIHLACGEKVADAYADFLSEQEDIADAIDASGEMEFDTLKQEAEANQVLDEKTDDLDVTSSSSVVEEMVTQDPEDKATDPVAPKKPKAPKMPK